MIKVTHLWGTLGVLIVLSALTTGCIERTVEYRYIEDKPITDRAIYNDLQPYVARANGNEYEDLSYIPKDFDDARRDYNWRLDLVKEQTARLDMLYAVKSGVYMEQREFKAWLDDLDSSTIEFVQRNLDAIDSGRVYIKYLNAEVKNLDYQWYSNEYDRVVKNEEIMKNDIKIAINDLNANVNKYNSKFVK